MIRSLLCLSVVAISSTSAIAAADTPPASVKPAFGNTIVSTYPDGRTGELWLSPGGTYTAEGRRGDKSQGHWRVKGDKLCLKQSRPMAIPFSYCTPVPKSGMSEAWSAKAATGEAITVKVVKGHQTGRAKA